MEEPVISVPFLASELQEVCHAMQHAMDGTLCPERDEEQELHWRMILAKLLSAYIRGTQEPV